MTHDETIQCNAVTPASGDAKPETCNINRYIYCSPCSPHCTFTGGKHDLLTLCMLVMLWAMLPVVEPVGTIGACQASTERRAASPS